MILKGNQKKGRQYNDQRKKDKRTNNYLYNISTKKTKDRAAPTPLKAER
jgi:hypothetical protein